MVLMSAFNNHTFHVIETFFIPIRRISGFLLLLNKLSYTLYSPKFIAITNFSTVKSVFLTFLYSGWEWEPSARPSFEDIHSELNNMFESNSVNEGM